jgi:hypothetical protein
MRVENPWSNIPPAFTHQDDIFTGAVALGCTPIWTGHLWECRCPRAVHAVSTAYTAITLPSLERARTEL